jgi:hypothetical protein
MINAVKNLFCILGLYLFPVVALAADLGLDAAKGIGLEGDLVGMIGVVVKYSLGLVGALALAMIVYGGFLYITAAGDPKQIEKAKTVIIYAIIGIIVIGVSFALVSFVVDAFSGNSSNSSGGNGAISDKGDL